MVGIRMWRMTKKARIMRAFFVVLRRRTVCSMGKTRSSACLLLPGYPVGGVRQAYDQPVGIPAGRLCGKLPTCGASDAAYLRASLASMHSVAWGTFISRSFGMSFPVVLQMPYVLFSIRTRAISRLRMNFI